MKTHKLIFFTLYFTSLFLYSQQNEGVVQLKSDLKKGKAYCDNLNFKSVDKESTLKLCKSIYTEKHRYREALRVIEIAQRKFPYSYEVRLQKALALNDLGSYHEATKEIAGLIQLYPEKFELHNYLARIQYNHDKVKSVMPFIISVLIDPEHPQAAENIIFIKRLLHPKTNLREGVSNTNYVLRNTGLDNFDLVKYHLSKTTESNELNSQNYLTERISLLCEALQLTSHNRKGFFWETYASYFMHIEQKDQIELMVNHMLNTNSTSQFTSFQKFNSNISLK